MELESKRKKKSIECESYPEGTEYLENLYQWLEIHPKVENQLIVSTFPKKLPNGEINYFRGITPKKDLSNGDLVLEIPLELILGEHLSLFAKEKELEPFFEMLSIEKTKMGIEGDLLVVLLLVAEKIKGNRSHWKHYIDSLPTSYHSSSLWDKDKVEYLKGSSAYEETIRIQTNMKKTYENVMIPLSEKYPHLFNTSDGLHNIFEWAIQSVLSRSFSLESPDQPGLVPLADMTNHSTSPHGMFGYDKETKMFRVICIEPCQKGEEFTISYGEKSNADLLCEYGFILEENCDDQTFLSVEEYEIEQEKKEFLMDVLEENTRFWIEMDEWPIALFIWLRVYFMSREEFIHFQGNFHSNPITTSNEIKCIREMVILCDKAISRYSTEKAYQNAPFLAHRLCELERKILVNLKRRVQDYGRDFLKMISNSKKTESSTN